MADRLHGVMGFSDPSLAAMLWETARRAAGDAGAVRAMLAEAGVELTPGILSFCSELAQRAAPVAPVAPVAAAAAAAPPVAPRSRARPRREFVARLADEEEEDEEEEGVAGVGGAVIFSPRPGCAQGGPRLKSKKIWRGTLPGGGS